MICAEGQSRIRKSVEMESVIVANLALVVGGLPIASNEYLGPENGAHFKIFSSCLCSHCAVRGGVFARSQTPSLSSISLVRGSRMVSIEYRVIMFAGANHSISCVRRGRSSLHQRAPSRVLVSEDVLAHVGHADRLSAKMLGI